MDLDLVHEDGDTKGAFYLRDDDGETLGEMTYSKAGDHLLIFDHTWVDDSLRGEGQARRLLDHAMEWVRSEGKKVNPLCPYVKSQFDKDERFDDLRA